MILQEIMDKCKSHLEIIEKQKDRISKKIEFFIMDDIRDFAPSLQKFLNSEHYSKMSDQINYEKIGKAHVFWKFSIIENKLFIFKRIFGHLKIDRKNYFFDNYKGFQIFTEDFFIGLRKLLGNPHPKKDYINLLKYHLSL